MRDHTLHEQLHNVHCKDCSSLLGSAAYLGYQGRRVLENLPLTPEMAWPTMLWSMLMGSSPNISDSALSVSPQYCPAPEVEPYRTFIASRNEVFLIRRGSILATIYKLRFHDNIWSHTRNPFNACHLQNVVRTATNILCDQIACSSFAEDEDSRMAMRDVLEDLAVIIDGYSLSIQRDSLAFSSSTSSLKPTQLLPMTTEEWDFFNSGRQQKVVPLTPDSIEAVIVGSSNRNLAVNEVSPQCELLYEDEEFDDARLVHKQHGVMGDEPSPASGFASLKDLVDASEPDGNDDSEPSVNTALSYLSTQRHGNRIKHFDIGHDDHPVVWLPFSPPPRIDFGRSTPERTPSVSDDGASMADLSPGAQLAILPTPFKAYCRAAGSPLPRSRRIDEDVTKEQVVDSSSEESEYVSGIDRDESHRSVLAAETKDFLRSFLQKSIRDAQ